MEISDRRRKIIDIFDEKGPLSYNEILNEPVVSEKDPIEILSDLDTLVFFRFLQKAAPKKGSKLTPETKLKIRPETEKQLKNDPSRVLTRIKKLEREVPHWYRKLATLKVLTERMTHEDIVQKVNQQFPHVRWHPSLIEASLRILKKKRTRKKQDFILIKEEPSGTYLVTSDGEPLLGEDPIQQFLYLRKLKDEFTNEFRAFKILECVSEFGEGRGGVSSGKIASYLRSEYGIRGNNRRAIKNTLDNMVVAGLLIVSGRTEKKEGHIYWLGPTVSPLVTPGGVNKMEDYHPVKDFKETVEEFFETCKIFDVKKDVTSRLEQILYDLQQCHQDLSLRSPEEWVEHIVFLSQHLKNAEKGSWEKRIFPCIVACILSRLLPAAVSVRMLQDYPLPSPPSKSLYHYYNGIAREYYFNLTDAYVTCGEKKKAFCLFERLEPLCWESFDFLILKGTIQRLKCNIRSVSAVREVLGTFEKALSQSEGRERIIALFHTGLTHYRRGDFDQAEKAWKESLNLERVIDGQVNLSHNVANAYRASGNLEKAQKLYERSIVLTETLPEGMEEYRMKSRIGLANVFIDLGLWEKAEEILKKVLKESAEKGMRLMAAYAQTNLGILLNRKGNCEEALTCYEKALEMVNECTEECCPIHINRGETLRTLKRMEEALEAFDTACTMMGNGDLVLIHAYELGKADLFCDTGNLDESLKLCNAVFNESWIGNKRSEGEAQRILGKVYLLKNERQKAHECLKESEGIFKKLDLKYELLKVYRELEKYYKETEDEEKEISYKTERRALEQLLGLS